MMFDLGDIEPMTDETFALCAMTAFTLRITPREEMCENAARIADVAEKCITVMVGEILRLKGTVADLEKALLSGTATDPTIQTTNKKESET